MQREASSAAGGGRKGGSGSSSSSSNHRSKDKDKEESLQSTRPHIRGIFSEEEDPKYWRDIVAKYPNKIPRFASKADAVSFIKKYANIKTNPDEPHVVHSISTLTEWDQIERLIIPKMIDYNLTRQPLSPAIFGALSGEKQTNLPQGNIMDMSRISHSSSNSNSNSNNSSGSSRSDDMEEGGSVNYNRYFPSSLNPDPGAKAVYDSMLSRLDLSVHQSMADVSTMNTLRYLFFHTRHGILVMIRNNKVVVFCPFVNKNYTNNWGNDIKVDAKDNSFENFITDRCNLIGPQEYIKDKMKWWANGNIICNQHPPDKDYWGDHFLLVLRDMIAETCREREIPDCDFFINKRDYPQLKYNDVSKEPVEPYGFVFDKDDRIPEKDIPLGRFKYKSYAPILSFYSSNRFADILFPPTEDWLTACGDIFPASLKLHVGNTEKETEESAKQNAKDLYQRSNMKKFELAWESKVNTAFWRGSATGGGVTPETNQRLHLAMLDHTWNSDPAKRGSPAYLDAKLITLNKARDKKIAGTPMTYIRESNFPKEMITKMKKKNPVTNQSENFVNIYEQPKWKYAIYVEGHCAACRYGFMMQMGCVILKIESKCVADQMWYFPLLKPFEDHVPVKADLSDLREKIEWCRQNDEKCRSIAAKSKELYEKYVSRDAILDYLQTVFVEISKRWCVTPKWCTSLPNSIDFGNIASVTSVYTSTDSKGNSGSMVRPPPRINLGDARRRCDDKDHVDGVCAYCKKLETLPANSETIGMSSTESADGGMGGKHKLDNSNQTASKKLKLTGESGEVSLHPKSAEILIFVAQCMQLLCRNIGSDSRFDEVVTLVDQVSGLPEGGEAILSNPAATFASISKIWKHDPTPTTTFNRPMYRFAMREAGAKLVPGNIDYFFDRIDLFFSNESGMSYTPTSEDIKNFEKARKIFEQRKKNPK